MVAYYTIAGRQIGSHHLSMLTLATLFGGSAFAFAGGKAKQAQGPPINAGSSDEENFIKDFLKNAEAEQKKEQKPEPTKH